MLNLVNKEISSTAYYFVIILPVLTITLANMLNEWNQEDQIRTFHRQTYIYIKHYDNIINLSCILVWIWKHLQHSYNEKLHASQIYYMWYFGFWGGRYTMVRW